MLNGFCLGGYARNVGKQNKAHTQILSKYHNKHSVYFTCRLVPEIHEQIWFRFEMCKAFYFIFIRFD